MANEIETKVSATADLTITLGGMGAGAARQSTMVNNSVTRYQGAVVFVRIKSDTAPTAGQAYEVFLLRGDDASAPNHLTDGAGTTDAAITIENAPLIGIIVVTATTNKNFYGEFDTSFSGILGPYWGIAIRNSTTVALNATGHQVKWIGYLPEVQ